MVAQGKNEAFQATNTAEYDRQSELKAFDETKAGVKGLVDAGVTEIPRMFHNTNPNDFPIYSPVSGDLGEMSIPVIDLGGLMTKDPARRREIVEKVGEASEKWGFFQIVNHGIAESVLEELKDGVRRFHEQDGEAKKAFYTRDTSALTGFNSNFDLYTGSFTNWRDTFFAVHSPISANPQDLPSILRDIYVEFSAQVMKLGILLFELLSEALGLSPNHLYKLGCAEGLSVLGHYYPACPQPELTLGGSKHKDNDFLTVLLQDHIGGLQVLHANKWVNVPPHPGALVINIGDLVQILSNDRFKSVEHRVLAGREARVSIANFFTTYMFPTNKIFGPIKELLSETNPPKFRETTVMEYTSTFAAKGLHAGKSTIDDFRV